MISAFCDPSPIQADLSKQAGRTYKQLQECKKLLCKLSNQVERNLMGAVIVWCWHSLTIISRGCGLYKKLTFSSKA